MRRVPVVSGRRGHSRRVGCQRQVDWPSAGEALARGYEYVFQMDCDFSHDPRYLPLLLARARAGADLVLGSRYVRGGSTVNWPWLRRLVSRAGSLYARLALAVAVRDLTGGFKC